MLREIFLRAFCLALAVTNLVVVYGAGVYGDRRTGEIAAAFATVMIILAFGPENK